MVIFILILLAGATEYTIVAGTLNATITCTGGVATIVLKKYAGVTDNQYVAFGPGSTMSGMDPAVCYV